MNDLLYGLILHWISNYRRARGNLSCVPCSWFRSYSIYRYRVDLWISICQPVSTSCAFNLFLGMFTQFTALECRLIFSGFRRPFMKTRRKLIISSRMSVHMVLCLGGRGRTSEARVGISERKFNRLNTGVVHGALRMRNTISLHVYLFFNQAVVSECI